MSQNTAARVALQQSLKTRVTTQKVMQHIIQLDVFNQFPNELQKDIKVFSRAIDPLMREDFAPVDDAKDQLTVLSQLFPEITSISEAMTLDVFDRDYLDSLKKVTADLYQWLAVTPGISAEQTLATRLVAGNENLWQSSSATSKKAYLKRLRAVTNFDKKVARVRKALNSRYGLMTAKSRLARLVDADKLNDVALAYVAYVVARANRRTRFQLETQSKAFDTIVDGLFKLLPQDTAWDQVALVAPVESVFRKLDVSTQATTLALFYNEMVFWAELLEQEWVALPQNVQKTFVVSHGTNSTDFNAFAGAFNTMRSGWIAGMTASGLSSMFDMYLPGKAIRLLAADLVRWNYYVNDSYVSADAELFAKLPYPWDVIKGDAELTRAIMVDVDVLDEATLTEKGWVSPRSGLEFEAPAPDPALVHGVTVANPELAVLLRKIGVFSSKPLKHSVITGK